MGRFRLLKDPLVNREVFMESVQVLKSVSEKVLFSGKADTPKEMLLRWKTRGFIHRDNKM